MFHASFFCAYLCTERSRKQKKLRNFKKQTIMQILVRILNQTQATIESYTDRRTNHPKTITKMGFELCSGGDSFYAEMLGEDAAQQGQLDTDALYCADLQLSMRNVTTEKGSFIKNTMRLRSISQVYPNPNQTF